MLNNYQSFTVKLNRKSHRTLDPNKTCYGPKIRIWQKMLSDPKIFLLSFNESLRISPWILLSLSWLGSWNSQRSRLQLFSMPFVQYKHSTLLYYFPYCDYTVLFVKLCHISYLRWFYYFQLFSFILVSDPIL